MRFVFYSLGVDMPQQSNSTTILYVYDHEVRHVRLNQAHPAQLTPSWFGDSVGHYEGDTLVIDTVGIKTGPCTMVGQFGAPTTRALHVIEPYRLIDYEAAKQATQLQVHGHLLVRLVLEDTSRDVVERRHERATRIP